MDLKELQYIDPDRHWYYQHKLRAVAAYLEPHDLVGGHLIDVGSGSGFFAKSVLHTTKMSRATCLDTGYDDEQVGTRGPITFGRSVDSNSADLYLFMDVLEHVDDDVGLLSEYLASASPGALVIVTVPAFQFLWSAHDVFLEHKRRYRLREVKAVCESVGLGILAARYLYAPVFPAVVAARLLRRSATPQSDLKQPSERVNRLLGGLCRAELAVPRNSWVGSTAIVVAQVAPSQ